MTNKERLAREIAQRISRYARYVEEATAERRFTEAQSWADRSHELFSLAGRLEVYTAVEDDLYLMEGGPE